MTAWFATSLGSSSGGCLLDGELGMIPVLHGIAYGADASHEYRVDEEGLAYIALRKRRRQRAEGVPLGTGLTELVQVSQIPRGQWEGARCCTGSLSRVAMAHRVPHIVRPSGPGSL